MNARLVLLLSVGLFVCTRGSMAEDKTHRFAAERGAILLPQVVQPSDPEAKTDPVLSGAGVAAGAAGLATMGLLRLLMPSRAESSRGIRPKILQVGTGGCIVGIGGTW